jgi:hypothetical protein
MMVRALGAGMVGFGIVFVGVSMKLNYFAGLRLGESPAEGEVFAWLAVAVAGVNAGLPFAIARGARRSEWSVVVAGSLLLALFLLYSLGSAIGYAVSNRGAVVGGHEALTTSFKALQRQETDLRARLDAIKTKRPPGVIEADIARQKQDGLWTVTKECGDATATASRNFCKSFEALRAELAGSVEAVALRDQLVGVERELTALRAKGAGREPDPQASQLGRLLGLSTDKVRSGWSVLFAVLVELGCAFVPFIGLSMLGIQHAPPPVTSGDPPGGEDPVTGPDGSTTPAARSVARKRSGQGRRRSNRQPFVARPATELPPLRQAEFGEDGQLNITDQ